MKQLILPLFTLFTCAASAQFSIVPQLGVEMAGTRITSGDFASFLPVGQQFTPAVSVRMAYTLKSGQGAFLGVGTSSPAVELQFANPQNVPTSYLASAKDLRLRLEAGYQFTSKPITLKKPVSTNNYAPKYGPRNSGIKQSGCSRSMCGRMRNPSGNDNRPQLRKITQDNGFYMRVKPSVGLAIAPIGSKMGMETKAGQYTYRAGLNTAVIAGTAFEFGSRNQPRLLISINYLRGIGDNTQTVTSNETFKPAVTTFSSKTSGFNINFGIPFNLKKKPAIIATPKPATPYRSGGCGRYKIYEM